MSGLSDVKGGKYQLIDPTWDEILSKPGEPFNFKRHHRGDIVTLDVETARRLVNAGAVVEPGSIEKAKAARAKAAAEEAQRQYEEALASLPEDIRADYLLPSAAGAGALDITANAPVVLAGVDGDKERAQQALEAETGEGGKNRSTLVEQLQKILAS